MIFDIIRNGFSLEVLVSLMARVFVIFCVMPIHEFAHAFVAYKLGDDTARLSGRLTLNPLAHVDLVGALMIFLVGFGYAKPVPVNPRNFKNPKGGMAATAVFNLIPIPPLDGSRILNLIIPSKYYFKIMKYERYIILGVFALLFFGVLDAPLSAITSAVTKLFINLANLPFSLIK